MLANPVHNLLENPSPIQNFDAEKVYHPKASAFLYSIPHTGASDTLFEDTERASSSCYIPKVYFVK